MFKKIFITLILSLNVSLIFSQKYSAKIITTNNDTIKTKIELDRNIYDVNRLRFLQDMIITYQNNEKRIYLPFELISFEIEIDYKIYFFDNMNDKFFAQRLYFNKVKVNKHIQPSTNILFTSYLISRPNSKEFSFLPVTGLSNLVSRKAMLKEFADCKILYDRIYNREIRIKEENDFIKFIKVYEEECYK